MGVFPKFYFPSLFIKSIASVRTSCKDYFCNPYIQEAGIHVQKENLKALTWALFDTLTEFSF